MITYIVFIVSFVLASLVFLTKRKTLASIISFISIGLNSYFIAKIGLFDNFYVSNSIGYFGFTVNDLNLAFIFTILAVSLSSLVYSLHYMKDRFEEVGENWGLYFGLFSLFAISMLYVVISVNLLELYIFLEIALITSFLLIMLYGYGDRRRISLLYFIWTHIGTIILLSSIIIIGISTGSMDIYSSYGVFANYSTVSYAILVFFLAIIGMMVKSAQAGFNIWLPYAHGEAPTPISVLLSPNMVGLGVFVIILYYYLFPSFSYLAVIFIGWSLITMIYGGINAIAQKDFKRFLAYSSVSQMGYMLLGASIAYLLGLGSSVYELPLGIIASILVYVSHGFGKAILFMSAGASITEFKERNIYNLGGIYLSSPLHSTLAFFGILNILGLPPSIGLISEALLLFSAGQLVNYLGAYWIIIALAIFLGIGISSGYVTYLYKKVFAGTSTRQSIDRILEYSIPMGVLAGISIILFFVPQYFVSALNNFIPQISGNDYSIFLIVIFPILGSLLAIILPKSLNQNIRGSIVVSTIALSMILSVFNLINALSLNKIFYEPVLHYQLFGYFQFSSSLLQAILAIFVSTLSFFIALYSIGYMKEDNVLRRYWGFFGFFVTSMLAVVLSDNIILFMAGWEGTSLASYGLIGYWLDDNERNVVGDFKRYVMGLQFLSRPTTSGIRAMIFTRIGDVGLFLGLGYLLYITSYSTYRANTIIYNNGIFSYLHLISTVPLALILLIFLYLGGLSKSAQFPFTQWLVTAMTGPTPVSALIHAATMVNLGAMFTFLTYPFLVTASNPTIVEFLSIITGISLFTAIYTSLNALVSNEQKVILANSTADQISLMIFASSLGALLSIVYKNPLFLYAGIGIGIIQMIAHGLYKASLFMNAGAVIHAINSRYIGEFPNLYKNLKTVFYLQLIAALNLANIPPLIGFWAHSFISSLTGGYLSYIYIILEFIGSIYIIRYVSKTFLWGKGEKEVEHHKDSSLLISPFILVLATIILGILIPNITTFFSNYILVPRNEFYFNAIDFVASLVGVFIAFTLYTSNLDFYKYSMLRPFIDFLYYGWYIYPLLDKLGLYSFKFYNEIFEKVETRIIDTTLNVRIPQGVLKYGSLLFLRIQNGVLRSYIGYYIGGIILFLIIVLIIFGVI